MEKLKAKNLERENEIDKEIKEKNQILLNFYSFNQFEKEEDRLLFIMSGARTTTMARQEHKDIYIELFSEMFENKNFFELLSNNLTDITKFTGKNITNILGIISDVSQKVFNDKQNENRLTLLMELKKNLEKHINAKGLYYFYSQFLSNYLENQKHTEELEAIGFLDGFLNASKNCINFFGYLKNMKEGVIKFCVKVIYNIYQDAEKRDKILMDFSNKIDKEYQFTLITAITDKEKNKHESKNTIDNITVTNIDELKFKDKAYVVEKSYVEKEINRQKIKQENVEIKTNNSGKHAILEVEMKVKDTEEKRKYSLEIQDMNNITLENVKVYRYYKESKDKSGIRTEIKFDSVEIENKFKEQIIDAICEGKGIETEGKDCNTKLTMAVGAIQKGKVKEQEVSKSKGMLSSFSSKNWSMSIQKGQQRTNQQTSFLMGSGH